MPFRRGGRSSPLSPIGHSRAKENLKTFQEFTRTRGSLSLRALTKRK